MSTLAHQATSFADIRHHPITTAALVSVFWIAAAILVATCHAELNVLPPWGGTVAAIAAILGISYAYTSLCARQAGMLHALGVGNAWLLLAIVAEIVVTRRLGHAWYSLIGSPDRPVLRIVLLFTWIFAPALFAHREVLQ